MRNGYDPQFLTQLRMIDDLAVTDDRMAAGGTRNRLAATFDVDDAEAAHPSYEVSVDKKTVVIRTVSRRCALAVRLHRAKTVLLRLQFLARDSARGNASNRFRFLPSARRAQTGEGICDCWGGLIQTRYRVHLLQGERRSTTAFPGVRDISCLGSTSTHADTNRLTTVLFPMMRPGMPPGS